VTATNTSGGGTATATTDAAGAYSIANLDGGTYDVDVAKSGCTSPGKKTVTVVPPGSVTADFQMQCTTPPNKGNVKGKVTDAVSSAAIPGARVDAIQGGSSKGTANTDASGDYAISALDPGTYIIQVSAAGYTMKNVTGVVVTAGADTTTNVALSKPSQPGKGGVVGTVRESGPNTPVDGATVKLLQGTNEIQSVVTAADGTYSMTNIDPGTYTVEVSKTDYETSTKPATVQADKDTTVDVSIKKKAAPPPPVTDKGIFGMGSMVDFAIIGAIIAVVVVLLLVMMMMRKKKGAESALGPPGYPPQGPPQQQWDQGQGYQQGYDPNQQWQQPPQGGQGGWG
jgi:hypothetical protein